MSTSVATGAGAVSPSTRRSLVALRPAPLLALTWLASFVFLRLAYAHFGFSSVMGDDLDLLVRSRTPDGYASGFWQSFGQDTGGKYRPGLTPVLWLVTHTIGSDFGAWILLDTALLSTNAVLLAVLAWRLSRGSYVVAGLVVLAALASRFASYFVLQGYGVMESLALLWVLVALVAVERAWALDSSRLLAAASAGYLLAVFTHERYIVLAAFLVVAALLAPWRMTAAHRIGLALLPVAVALLNYGMKTWVLHIDFFTSGGSANATSLSGIARFMLSAAFNTVGYNEGPAYLSGNDVHSLGLRGIAVALVLCAPLGALALTHASLHLRSVRAWAPVLLAASLWVPLLLSASIQARQEYRWIYAPFVALLLGIAWVSGQLPVGSRLAWLPVVALAGSVTVDTYYRPVLPNTYFFAGQATADSVRDVVIAPHRAELADSTVIFVSSDGTFDNWYMGRGTFFDIYAPGHGPVVFTDTEDKARAIAATSPHPLLFAFQGDKVAPL